VKRVTQLQSSSLFRIFKGKLAALKIQGFGVKGFSPQNIVSNSLPVDQATSGILGKNNTN
jgi:hypothetical protein